MDPDLLQIFEELYKSYKDQDKIKQITQMCETLRGKKGNKHDFLIGSFYGSSLYLFETFSSNEVNNKEEFNNLLKNHVEGLNSFINNYLESE